MFVICFISQWIKRSKHGLFVFLPKKTLIWRRHCFWLANRVAVWCQSKVSVDFSKVLGHEVFSPERLLNKPKAMRVCIHSISQSNRSISVCLLFLFCSHIFISWSYENRCNLIHSFAVNVSYDSYFVNVCVLTAPSAIAHIHWNEGIKPIYSTFNPSPPVCPSGSPLQPTGQFSWSHLYTYSMRELFSGSQPTATTCLWWSFQSQEWPKSILS